jgi:hypothetical protein
VDWVYTQVDPVVAGLMATVYAAAAVVRPLWTTIRIGRGAPVDPYRHWFVAAHLVGVLLLVAVVPGIDAGNLGLSWQSGGDWPAALVGTALYVAVAVMATSWAYSVRKAKGRYVDAPLPDLTEITEKVVVGSRDALLFVAVPMLLAVGVFDLPPRWAVVGAALLYGFHHLSTGRRAVPRTAAAVAALIVYLLCGHIALPALILVTVTLLPEYGWPRTPPEPPPVAALTVVEPPMPLR